MQPLIQRIHALLRWSEKYTRTDMVYFSKSSFWLIVERATAVIAGFGMSVAFANLLEPEKYGVYKYVLAVIGIVGAFSLGGMITAVSQASARGFEGSLRAGFHASLKWSIGSIVLAFGIAAYYFVRGNETLGFSFLLGGSFTPLISAACLYDNFLAGTKRFSVKAIYGAVRNVTPPLALILTLSFIKDPIALIAAYFVSTTIATYFCYTDVLKRFVTNNKTDDTTLAYSKHLSIINILGVLAAQADRILVFTFLGGTALAVYAIAEAVPDQIRSVASIASALALPKLADRPVDELKRELPRKALIMFGVSLFAAITYIAIAPFFFSLFFPHYLSAVAYSQIYALTVLVIPGVLFSTTLLAHMKKRQLYIQRIVSATSEIALLIVLVPLYGIWGAIAATLITYAISNILLIWQFSRL